MNRKLGVKAFIPLIFSAAGIILWVVAALLMFKGVLDHYFNVQLPNDLIMFLVSLILPVITLILFRPSVSVQARKTVGTIALIFAAVQLAASIALLVALLSSVPSVYTHFLAFFPGYALAGAAHQLLHGGSIIALVRVLSNAALIASSLACWLVLRRRAVTG